MMELNNSMTGGGGCMSAVRGYEDFELDGKRYRVYGGLNGMTPREYVDSWGKPLTNGDFKRNSKKASPPKPKRQPKWSLPENPTRRQPSRSAKERMTKGGKRKSHKGHNSHKSRKSHKNRK